MISSNRGKPSLKATAVGLARAQRIFKQRGLTRQRMAQSLGIDRSVVGKFLRGDKVWSQKFEEICGFLELPWQEIAEGIEPQDTLASSDVQTARSLVSSYIAQRCNTLRIPGMVATRTVDAAYTQLQVIAKAGIPSALEPLETGVSGERMVLNHPHVHILGLPGSGKTTLLKYLALGCIQGKFQPDLVPIFIALRDISQLLKEYDLFTCISQIYSKSCGLEAPLLQTLFDNGNILLLLDGEDEIPAERAKKIALTTFDLFYKNRVVITCRTGVSQSVYGQFIQATIQPFSDNQIAHFCHHWFQTDPQKETAFLGWLNSVKADGDASFELAGSPLLLALLCIVFERQAAIPNRRSQIYEQAFGSILDELNANHILSEKTVIAPKTYQDKLALFTKIATLAFQNEQKLFTASSDFLDQVGCDISFCGGLSAKDFCRDLEATYGIITQDGWNSYRFTHLSFHEYFVALAWANRVKSGDSFAPLLSHMFKPDWYEVFLFFVEMLPVNIAREFLQAFKANLVDYLAQQSPMALRQIQQGRSIATHIIHSYKTQQNSPAKARAVLNTGAMEPALVISAFCADYYYRFDPARRISRVFDVDYRFNHDLVLAHCFKCNLSPGMKHQRYDFANALSHVWTLKDLHQQIQTIDSVAGVRALFFDYVLTHPDQFSAECVQTLKSHQKVITTLAQQSQQAAIAKKSQLVADISNPAQETDTFLGSAEYGFPTDVYQQPATVATLRNYYHGCTLLCNCLGPDLNQDFQKEILSKLFSV